jgi:hypothetical protein
MSYLFTGRLRAHTCGGSVVPVANATLMVYRNPEGEDAGFVIRGHEDIRGREYTLMAQGRTDENGEFRIDFSRKTIFGHRGSAHVFAGEPFILDVCVRTAEGMPDDYDPETVQFSVGTVQATWREEGENQLGSWEDEISEADWSRVRSALDAWTIHGRVIRSGDRSPVQGVNVLAFDADLMQDDYLGSATTDADGHFRLDYPGSAFRQTSVRGADFERGGPELYFRIETADGQVIYKEDKSRGNKPDRADASNCFSVELSVEGAPPGTP